MVFDLDVVLEDECDQQVVVFFGYCKHHQLFLNNEPLKEKKALRAMCTLLNRSSGSFLKDEIDGLIIYKLFAIKKVYAIDCSFRFNVRC